MEIQNSCVIHENNKNKHSFYFVSRNSSNLSNISYQLSSHLSSQINPYKLHKSPSNDLINEIKTNEYSLTHNFFDPSESSPPNDFLNKLTIRMQRYQKKDMSLFNEY